MTHVKTVSPALREVARLLGAYVGAVAGISAALLVLDSIPALLLGGARGVRVHAEVETAESAVGARLFVPAYFPESYRWPPRRIRTVTAPSRAAALTLASRDGHRPDLLIVQSLDGDVPLPTRLLPPGQETHRVALDLDGTPATLTDVLLPPDGTFFDLAFVAAGRRVVFRFQGPPEEVLQMARSLPRGAPR